MRFGGWRRGGGGAMAAIAAAAGVSVSVWEGKKVRLGSSLGVVQAEEAAGLKRIGGEGKSWPTFTRAEVERHKRPDEGVWVTYHEGVYDITEFVANHPGGADKIMLAAGKAIDPFWHLYQQHYASPLPQELLAEMKIGELDPKDIKVIEAADLDCPFKNDPSRHPALIMHAAKPCNAETPNSLLMDSWITPNDLWYVRNHHPCPDIKAADYKLRIQGPGVKEIELSLEDLKKFPKYEVVATMQCGGNRRGGLDSVLRTSGTSWGLGAMSTARWSGARLRDVLEYCGLPLDIENAEQKGIHHVQFEGHEEMKASIPVDKAIDPRGDVILAYEMNGVDIPRDHGYEFRLSAECAIKPRDGKERIKLINRTGNLLVACVSSYPVRAIVPGIVGVRNVKWVVNITLSDEEATGPWQRGINYKGFAPGRHDLNGVVVEKVASIQEQPVTSGIVEPSQGAEIEGDEVYIRGFAWSGGGRGIVRVDVSIDGGKTWREANLKEGSEQKLNRAWAWTFWDAEIEIPLEFKGKDIEICCKAIDASYNTQPERAEPIWNLRGLNNNSWHRVKASVAED